MKNGAYISPVCAGMFLVVAAVGCAHLDNTPRVFGFPHQEAPGVCEVSSSLSSPGKYRGQFVLTEVNGREVPVPGYAVLRVWTVLAGWQILTMEYQGYSGTWVHTPVYGRAEVPLTLTAGRQYTVRGEVQGEKVSLWLEDRNSETTVTKRFDCNLRVRRGPFGYLTP
jgi:hypothetical protein